MVALPPGERQLTDAVICCGAWAAASKVGSFNWAMLLHGSQRIRPHAPLLPAGRLNVSSEVVDILHGLCTYGVAGRVLVAELGSGDATRIREVGARFTSPVFPGETLTTSVWRTASGRAVFRTEAAGPDGADARPVLEDGTVEYE